MTINCIRFLFKEENVTAVRVNKYNVRQFCIYCSFLGRAQGILHAFSYLVFCFITVFYIYFWIIFVCAFRYTLLIALMNHWVWGFYIIYGVISSKGVLWIYWKLGYFHFLYQLHTFIKWKHCHLANRLYCTIQSKQCFEKMNKVLKFCFLKLVFPKTLFCRKADEENFFVNFLDYFGQI